MSKTTIFNMRTDTFNIDHVIGINESYKRTCVDTKSNVKKPHFCNWRNLCISPVSIKQKFHLREEVKTKGNS